MMKRIIDRPQMSDMGSGFGHIEIEQNTVTLAKALKWLQQNQKTWGTVTIYYGDSGDIVRRFDYDLFKNNIFYHHLNGWQYEYIVKKIEFNYCFMSEDIDVYCEVKKFL